MAVIAIIGGGASGLCAAIEAGWQCKGRAKIILLDTMPRCGKKILATGNGRCNLSNQNVEEQFYHGDISLCKEVFAQYTPESTLAFFEELGLFLRTDAAGRIYPMSLQASAVLDTLRFAAERAGVEIYTQQKVETIERAREGYLLNGSVYADRVVLACGGKAQPVHGADGSGYALCGQLGVAVETPFPALTALCADNFPKALKGIRADGRIDIRCDGKMLASSTGEIQYTEYGLSGIPAMQVSRAASAYFTQGGKKDCIALVDRAPAVTAEALREYLLKAIKTRSSLLCEDLLTGILPKRLGMSVLTDASLAPQKTLTCVNAGAVDAIVNGIKKKKYRITSVCGFQDAQVTAGGVPEAEIDAKTLALRKAPGVFVCGELVNVDGDCGGYNLLWAWNSGRLAGRSAADGCLC